MADDLEVTPQAGELTTANYGWIKPTVGASDDAWGGYLNTDLDGIDSTVKSVSNAIPLASSTTPAANGTAAVGSGTTWARADHAHPTDTSGWLGDNRIINGNFAVNQRIYVSGTGLATTVYGHDRWKAGPSGCTYTFTAALPDTTITITANTLTQVIEAGMIEGGVYTLSWTGTAQARVYQGTPTGSYAASPVVTASLTAGTNTIVEFNTGTLTKVKFEIGSVATPFNRQSIARSIADCQRYYQQLGGIVAADIIIRLYASAAAQNLSSTLGITAMRAAPTATAVGAWQLVNTTAITFTTSHSTVGFNVAATGVGLTTAYANVGTYLTLNSEL